MASQKTKPKPAMSAASVRMREILELQRRAAAGGGVAQSNQVIPTPPTGSQSMLAELTKENLKSDRDVVRASGKARVIEIDKVDGDPHQPRRTFDQMQLQQLAGSIAAVGILQLPIVRPHPEKEGRYMIVVGERRLRASRLLGLPSIEVRYEEWDDETAGIAQIIENSDATRAGVDPWEEAAKYGTLLKKFGTQKALVDRMGLPKEHVSKRLRLLELPEEVRELNRRGILTDIETALNLGRLYEEHPKIAKDVVARAFKTGTIQREWVTATLRSARAERGPVAPSNSSVPPELAQHLKRYDQHLSKRAGRGGARVAEMAFTKSGKGGAPGVRLSLEFTSLGALDALLNAYDWYERAVGDAVAPSNTTA